jgi:hypothetical protein
MCLLPFFFLVDVGSTEHVHNMRRVLHSSKQCELIEEQRPPNENEDELINIPLMNYLKNKEHHRK